MVIRPTTPNDMKQVTELYLAAFPREERELVASLAVSLSENQATGGVLALVAEAEAEPRVLGHICFSPVDLVGADDWKGQLLAPLVVLPQRQREGIGTNLVQAGLKQLSTDGIEIVFVYGDPAYYSKFGFSQQAAAPFTPPYDLEYNFGWQAQRLAGCDKEIAPAGQLACVPALRNPQLW